MVDIAMTLRTDSCYFDCANNFIGSRIHVCTSCTYIRELRLDGCGYM